jgi:hypothetical protein
LQSLCGRVTRHPAEPVRPACDDPAGHDAAGHHHRSPDAEGHDGADHQQALDQLAGKPGKGRKPCTLRKAAGSLTRKLSAGITTITFTGRVGSRALAAGRYELRAVATDAAGNASVAKTATLTVLAK